MVYRAQIRMRLSLHLQTINPLDWLNYLCLMPAAAAEHLLRIAGLAHLR